MRVHRMDLVYSHQRFIIRDALLEYEEEPRLQHDEHILDIDPDDLSGTFRPPVISLPCAPGKPHRDRGSTAEALLMDRGRNE